MNLQESFKSIGIEVEKAPDAKTVRENARESKAEKPIMLTGEGFNRSLVENALIPYNYVNLEYDPEKIKDELKKEWRKSKRYTVKGFPEYTSTLSGILTDLRMGRVPDRSYLIGFSSETPIANIAFAVTAIKLMYAHGMNVVPFVGCYDLCGVMNLENDRLSNEGPLRALEYNVYSAAKEYDRFNTGRDSLVKAVANEVLYKLNSVEPDESDDIGYRLTRNPEPTPFRTVIKKQPVFYRTLASRFSWSEYVNADLLICWIGIEGQMHAESKALASIMKARTAEGKPTICFINCSLGHYTTNQELYNLYWSEMEDLGDNVPRFNRFKRVSCYKQYSTLGKVSSGIDDAQGDTQSKETDSDDSIE